MANRWRNRGNSGRLYFGGLQNHCRWWLQPWNKKMLTPWKKSYDQTRQHVKNQRHYFANISPSSQGYGFSSGHVWMWELDYKESWVPKNFKANLSLFGFDLNYIGFIGFVFFVKFYIFILLGLKLMKMSCLVVNFSINFVISHYSWIYLLCFFLVHKDHYGHNNVVFF